MTYQQINIAIAEACGLLLNRMSEAEYTSAYQEWLKEEPHPHSTLTLPHREEWSVWPIPNYCHDLNAMHDAEKTIPENERWSYVFILSGIACTSGDYGWGEAHSTARQRAEAFLRTLNKWSDS